MIINYKRSLFYYVLGNTGETSIIRYLNSKIQTMKEHLKKKKKKEQ